MHWLVCMWSTQEDHEGKMPAYFRFLTLLAMKVFLEEAVSTFGEREGEGNGRC